MRKINYILLAILMVSPLISCEDILEEDISSNQITILSPNSRDTIQGNSVQFLWDPIDGATEYTIQIYTDNSIVEDTIVSKTPFTRVLSNGNFEWRIKGQNNAYQTQFNFPVSFTVVETSDLTNQTLILNSPSSGIFTNETDILFVWSSVPLATKYTFELQRVEQNGGISTVFIQEDIIETSIALDAMTIDEDAEYEWQVKALNETSETPFSSRNFFIDSVDPPIPSLLSPKFEEVFNLVDIIQFSWNFSSDPGIVDSEIEGYYEISSDENFNIILESGSNIQESIDITFQNEGTYYWRVRGEDEAGNIGVFNEGGKLIVNE